MRAIDDISPGPHPKEIYRALGPSKLTRALRVTKGFARRRKERRGRDSFGLESSRLAFCRSRSQRVGQEGPQKAARRQGSTGRGPRDTEEGVGDLNMKSPHDGVGRRGQLELEQRK